MDFCGSSTDSWFYTAPQLYPSTSTNISGAIPFDHSSEPQPNENKWALHFLESLQNFSRRYQPIHGQICIVLCTFGLLTNILNFIVLTRPNMRTSINIILAAVALSDAGTMCSYLIYVIHFYVINHGVCLSEIYTYNWMVFILFHSLWSILLHSSSIWLAVLLAFMRLTVMQTAKLSHSFLKPGLVWRPMTYIYAPLAVLCIPVIFTHSVLEIELAPCGALVLVNETATYADTSPKNGAGKIEVSTPTTIGYTVLPSQAALTNNCLLLRAVLLINGICFKFLPCLLLVYSIWRLLQTLDAAKKRSNRMHRRSESTVRIHNQFATGKYFSSRTTKMLLIILSIFLVTELPQAFIATLSGLYPDDVYFKIYPTVGDVLDLLSLLNSGVNFVLYCGMSSRFRSAFIDLFVPTSLQRSVQRHRRRFSISDNDANTIGQSAASEARSALINGLSPPCGLVTAGSSRRALSVGEAYLSPDEVGNGSRKRQCSVDERTRKTHLINSYV